MSNKIKAVVSVLLAAVIVLAIHSLTSRTMSVGATPANCGGSVTCFTDLAVGNLFANTDLWLGGSSDASSIQEQVSTGSCTSATSTLFAVANPFSATSTATVQSVIITGQATTSSLLVGTSTTATGLTSLATPSLINSTNGVATTSSAYLTSGITVGSTGFVSAGSGTVRTIAVGPSDYVAAYSTSTATGAGAANYTPGYSSCTYKISWRR